MNNVRRLLGPLVFEARGRARDWRRRGSAAVDDLAVRAAPHLYREADRLSALPFRDTAVEAPDPELLDDLAAYTDLPRAAVDDLVCRRRPVDFRSEWHATPPALRRDHWFYLSAKTYLFANAVHFGPTEAEGVAALLPAGATVLDFGAGTGNLAIALARRGHRVQADELSALQRDFIRFRVHRHGLADRVTVLDPWTPAVAGTVDAITAFDVLEHLDDGRATLDERLLPALRPCGALIENSPFVLNHANPMHHEDWGLDAHLRMRGLSLDHAAQDGTRVWRAQAPATTSAAP